MKDLLFTLFGEYEPILNSDGEIIQGLSGIDYPWILGVLIFMLFLYCILRMIGGFTKNECLY